MNITFNGRQLTFDAVYHFAPVGNDETGDGSELRPFKTPHGPLSQNLLRQNNNRNICFMMEPGLYQSSTWFDFQNNIIVDNLHITLLSDLPERTIIECDNLLNLNHIGALTTQFTLSNITINWINIQDKGLVHFETDTMPVTIIRFTNILFNIGNLTGAQRWFFVSGQTQRGDVTFENCIFSAGHFFTPDSINPMPIISRGVVIINSLLHQVLNINSANTFAQQRSSLTVSNILQSHMRFPLNAEISHRGSNLIRNPDDGVSHLGVCGGPNAWHFDTYWYRFSYLNTDFDQIPLEQIKQHYFLHHFTPGSNLAEQISDLEQFIDTSGNRTFMYVLNSSNTYNILDFIESPHMLHYHIDDAYLGNYDPNDIHKVLIDIITPFYHDNQITIYRNGILLTEELQYEIKNKNSILLYSLNLGDEVYVYIGWENYLNKIHINYKLNEDGTESNKIDNITSEQIKLKSQYNYDIDNRLISQTLLTNDNVNQTRDYSYDRIGRLRNIIIR